MQLSMIVLSALAGSMSVNAAIAIGQQFRVSNVNYNVAWLEGLDPCSDDVAIGLKGEERCNIPFTIDGSRYVLRDCGTSKWAAYHTNGKFYGNCRAIDQKKISCSGSTHDVIKTALCG